MLLTEEGEQGVGAAATTLAHQSLRISRVTAQGSQMSPGRHLSGSLMAYASYLYHEVATWLALFCSMTNMQKSQSKFLVFSIAATQKLFLLQGCSFLNPNMITVCPWLSNTVKWEIRQKEQL